MTAALRVGPLALGVLPGRLAGRGQPHTGQSGWCTEGERPGRGGGHPVGQHYAEHLGKIDPDSILNLRNHFSAAQVREILAYVYFITFTNLSGNTVDAVLERVRGKGRPLTGVRAPPASLSRRCFLPWLRSSRWERSLEGTSGGRSAIALPLIIRPRAEQRTTVEARPESNCACPKVEPGSQMEHGDVAEETEGKARREDGVQAAARKSGGAARARRIARRRRSKLDRGWAPPRVRRTFRSSAS